ncbi:hypothetical protein Nepgr_012484 [Nepenthes gracilis]|uniref:Uncharacterized protein n=1 Tax=Nepenthes gracilis TaxID=150966 RepID=A0AAD3SG21_NEPGR|nr:hypothetical protein Nepgr_012484 [Nepenthes gracilis]
MDVRTGDEKPSKVNLWHVVSCPISAIDHDPTDADPIELAMDNMIGTELPVDQVEEGLVASVLKENLWQADEQLLSSPSFVSCPAPAVSTELVMDVKASINSFAVLQGPEASAEHEEFAKDWKASRGFGDASELMDPSSIPRTTLPVRADEDLVLPLNAVRAGVEHLGTPDQSNQALFRSSFHEEVADHHGVGSGSYSRIGSLMRNIDEIKNGLVFPEQKPPCLTLGSPFLRAPDRGVRAETPSPLLVVGKSPPLEGGGPPFFFKKSKRRKKKHSSSAFSLG